VSGGSGVPARHLEVPAERERLPEVSAFLGQFWEDAELPMELAFPFDLALEELFLNVVMHGTPPGTPTRTVRVELSAGEGHVSMRLEDDGVPFDPLSLPEPDITLPAEEREIGGLGIHLIRNLMDEVLYVHTGSHNRITLRKRLD